MQIDDNVLDLVVDISTYPTEKHARGAWNLRPIGLNHGNVGAVLMRNGIPYDSDEGRAWIAAITSAMTLFAAQQSVSLAKTMGKYPKFVYESHQRVLSMHASAIEKTHAKNKERKHRGPDMQWLVDQWKELIDSPSLKKHGMRNASLTTMAPQGTIGLVLDQDTLGCEPDFCLVKYKKLIGGSGMTIPNQSVIPALGKLGYSDQVVAKIMSHIQRFNTMEFCPSIKHEDMAVFDCAIKPPNSIDFSGLNFSQGEMSEAIGIVAVAKTKEAALESLPKKLRGKLEDRIKIFTRSISIDGHIKALAALQPHISLSCSKTVNMPNEATIDDVSSAFKQAHKMGIKCIAIYRDGCRQSQPLNASAGGLGTTVKQDKKRGEGEWSPSDWPAIHRKTPNHTSNCDRFKFSIADTSGHQSVFVNVVLYPDSNQIMELFINMGRQGDTVMVWLTLWRASCQHPCSLAFPQRYLARNWPAWTLDHRASSASPVHLGFTGPCPYPISLADFSWRYRSIMPRIAMNRSCIQTTKARCKAYRKTLAIPTMKVFPSLRTMHAAMGSQAYSVKTADRGRRLEVPSARYAKTAEETMDHVWDSGTVGSKRHGRCIARQRRKLDRVQVCIWRFHEWAKRQHANSHAFG
jgi:hypothetical protein